MNRKERVRREIPGAPEELVAELARRPAAEVTVMVAALRQARRDALAHERERRRERRANARRFGWYDESVLAARDERLLKAAGKRAGSSLEALETLATLSRQLDDVVHLAVDGLRARGYSDPEIGSALGITRQSVGERFGRRGGDDESQQYWMVTSPEVPEIDPQVREVYDDVMQEFADGRRCRVCGRVPGVPTAPCPDCPPDVRAS